MIEEQQKDGEPFSIWYVKDTAVIEGASSESNSSLTLKRSATPF